MIKKYSLVLMLMFAFISSSIAQTVTCQVDTLKYTYFKSSNFDTLSLNPVFTSAVYQYYESPQDISIRGVKFYAFKTDSFDVNLNYSDSMEVIVEIRNATLDSVPGNILLASDTINIGYADTADTSYTLNFYANVALFDPITTSNPYTVVIRTENDSNSFSFMHNEYDELNGGGDGDQEWLSGAYQGSGWVKSDVFSPNPNGIPFDADFFTEPIVSYSLTASFINDPECLFDELGDTVEFFNDASVIVDHRMYNRYAFFNQPGAQTWNYGDGSPVEQLTNPSHFYPTNGPFAATLTARIFNWSQLNCQSSKTQIIKEKPAQGFSYVTNNLDVVFTNETPPSSIFTNITYDFGDGNTSQSENPSHNYSQPGTYWVCQTMMTSCGLITECQNVAVATNTALNCGKDSVRYTAARGTDTRTLMIKAPQGTHRLVGLGQRFDAPQSMIVHGFSFYANHEGLYRDNFEVICKIWYEDPTTETPDTATGPLASSSVRINKYDVDTNYTGEIRYTAIFNVPVNLLRDEDYILTMEYFGETPVLISTTDWEEGDGDQDLFAVGQVVAAGDTFWVTPASVSLFNAQGMPFDADVLIEPLIEYNFNANFSYGFECLTFNSQGERVIEFQNLSSRIAASPMYNAGVFYNSTTSAYEWDFGDSTDISNQSNAQHLFQAPGPFDVELTIIMDGWTNDCQSSQVYNVPVTPTGGFSYEQVTSTVNFIDESHNADEYWWTFSDSTFSSLSDPIHYFLRLGQFEVCQYVSNVCGSDTTCTIVTVNILGIPNEFMEQMSIYPNPASDYLNIDADLSTMKSLELTLFDFSGRAVRSASFTNSNVNESIYVGDLARGAYLMELKAGDYKATKKFILTN